MDSEPAWGQPARAAGLEPITESQDTGGVVPRGTKDVDVDRLNGHGPTYSLPTKEFRGGDRYGEVRGVYYHRLRGTIRDLKVGDTVEVWQQAKKAKRGSRGIPLFFL